MSRTSTRRRAPASLAGAAVLSLVAGAARAQDAGGLTVTWYDDAEFTAPGPTSVVGPVAWDFGEGGPDPAIGPDSFSGRFTGFIVPRYDDAYTLFVRSDDGVRLFVDGELVIDNWVGQAPTRTEATLALVADVPVPVMLEYFEGGGGALLEFGWVSPQQGEEFVPADRMTPDSPFGAGPAAVSLTGTDVRAAEGSPDTAVLTLSRWGALDAPLGVNLRLGGTAEAGLDYVSAPSRVELRAGQSSARIVVARPDDPTYRGRRTLTVEVEPDAAYAFGPTTRVEIELSDDETPPRDPVSVIAGTLLAGENAEGDYVVQALDAADAVIAQQVLLGEGAYALSGLGAGAYTVRAFVDADGDRLPGEAERAGLTVTGGEARVAVTLPPDVLALDFLMGDAPAMAPDAASGADGGGVPTLDAGSDASPVPGRDLGMTGADASDLTPDPDASAAGAGGEAESAGTAGGGGCSLAPSGAAAPAATIFFTWMSIGAMRRRRRQR
jgi:uncharacterized protein (DUF2141 family)